MDFEGAIFDMDGTILDSMGIYKNIGRDFLLKRGIPIPEGLVKRVENFTLEQSAQYFSDNFTPELTLKEILEEWKLQLQKGYENSVELKAYTREFLDCLKAKNIPMAIATATPKPLALAALKRLEIDCFFKVILTVQEAGKDKNSPDIYLQAAHNLGLPPQKCAVFEDSPYAAKTAKEAGFIVYGIYDEAWEAICSSLKENCHHYISGFQELINKGV